MSHRKFLHFSASQKREKANTLLVVAASGRPLSFLKPNTLGISWPGGLAVKSGPLARISTERKKWAP